MSLKGVRIGRFCCVIVVEFIVLPVPRFRWPPFQAIDIAARPGSEVLTGVALRNPRHVIVGTVGNHVQQQETGSDSHLDTEGGNRIGNDPCRRETEE